MKKIFVLVIAIAGIAFSALNYHIILTDSGVSFLKKAGMTLEYTFVDARGAGRMKLLLNPALLEAGIRDILEKSGN